MSTLRHPGIAILLALATSPVAAQDLTGIWRDNTGGRYVVRQAGEEFCWTSEQNVFCGILTGPVIAGSWLDLPTGRFRGNGRMVLQIASPNRLVKLHQTANYAASVWTREGTSEPTPATPTPAPQPPPSPPASQPATPPSSPQPSGGPTSAPEILNGGTKDWTYRSLDGEYRSMTGKLIQFTCGPDPAPTEWRALYGTDIYTDDSVLCQAAVHAGKITTRGGTFTIEILPGQSYYAGSPRNGVLSVRYPPEGSNSPPWGGSFAFSDARVTYDAGSAPRPIPRSEPAVDLSLCRVAGRWIHSTTNVGTSTWNVDEHGNAKEAGLGAGEGTATLNGKVMTIKWHIGNEWAGSYTWKLDQTCRSGDGDLVFTVPANRPSAKSTVTHSQ